MSEFRSSCGCCNCSLLGRRGRGKFGRLPAGLRLYDVRSGGRREIVTSETYSSPKQPI